MTLDRDELTLRMVEAATGMRRPPGLTAAQALEYAPDPLRKAHERAGAAAIAYFIECAGPIDVEVLPSGRQVENDDRMPVGTSYAIISHPDGTVSRPVDGKFFNDGDIDYTLADVGVAEVRIREAYPNVVISRGDHGFALYVAKTAQSSVVHTVFEPSRDGGKPIVGDVDAIIAALAT